MNIFMRTMRQLSLYTLLLVIAATGCRRTPYTSSVSKIRLTAESIATVKGKPLFEGKYTVGNDIVTLKNSDIVFKADILKGKSPTVTFGSKKDVTQALSEGDNQVMVNITGSVDFEAVSFTITVHRTPAPPPQHLLLNQIRTSNRIRNRRTLPPSLRQQRLPLHKMMLHQ